MTVYLVVQFIICFAALATALDNFRYLRAIRGRRIADGEAPMISVLVPARNEAPRIEACLRSLAAQDYPRFEILALDDCSTDGTAEVIEEIAHEHATVRLLRGRELPEGWLGKNHACWQLAHAARGDVLLFTDADTVFAPGCLRYAAGVMADKGCGLLTGAPRFIAVGFWERISVPMLAMMVGTVASIRAMERLRSPLAAAGSGAFLMFRREAYFALGGHEIVRGHIVEDINLTRAAKRAGLGVGFCDAARVVSVRMYDSFASMWEGFTKNVYAATDGKLALFAAMIFYAWTVWVLPFVLFIGGPALGVPPWARWAPLASAGMICAARAATDRMFARPDMLGMLLMPFSGLLFTAIGLVSAGRTLLRRPTPWKGRAYELWKDQEKG